MFEIKALGLKHIGPFDGQQIRLPQTRFAALVGPSGTGKTTVLACLAAVAYSMLDGRSERSQSWYQDQLKARVNWDGTPHLEVLVKDQKKSFKLQLFKEHDFPNLALYWESVRPDPPIL